MNIVVSTVHKVSGLDLCRSRGYEIFRYNTNKMIKIEK